MLDMKVLHSFFMHGFSGKTLGDCLLAGSVETWTTCDSI
jgi:hypothetical protein